MTPLRVFIDSSVWLAAMLSATGASQAVLTLAEIGLLKVVVSSQVLIEVERNLLRKAPQAVPVYHHLVTVLSPEIVGEPEPLKVTECAQVILDVADFNWRFELRESSLKKFARSWH